MQPANSHPPELPGLRQDLQLLPGEVQSDGVPVWRIHDPVRNRFFEIGWIEFELLQRWRDGARPDDLIGEVAAETPLHPSHEEVDALLGFLNQHELLAPCTIAQRSSLLRRRAAKQLPLWTQLLHNYLFFRIPVLHPDAWLDRHGHKMTWVFGSGFITVTMAAGLTGMYLSGRQTDAVASAFAYFFNFEGLVYYALATLVAKALHEFGHALGAKRYGLRVPTVGIAFLVMMPVLYTDTSESWRLTNRSDRFGVALAGIGAEMALAAWTTLAWAITPDGFVRSAFFLLATTTWVWTLAINGSPFMRFDGYFLLSDLVGIPNLHERSFALARRLLRTTFFGIEAPDLEPAIDQNKQRAMIAFALVTWAYRLVIFLGIALLVYHFFFKLLGVLLMAVELGWFIALPIWREMQSVGRERENWRLRPLPWVVLFALFIAFTWIFPVSRQASAPALARNIQDTAVFARSSAQVREVRVKPGQNVRKGETLVVLESPDLASRAMRARMRAQGYAVEIGRTSANRATLEGRLVLEQQLGEALADEAGAATELAALTLVAPHDGRVRDMPSDLVEGRWVNSRHLLLRVVDERSCEIEAYFSESQVAGVGRGQSARFYPDDPRLSPFEGIVTEVDTANSRTVPHPMLASIHGGGIAAVQAGKDTLVAHETLYRVRLRAAEGSAGVEQVTRGTVRTQANLLAIASASIAHVASVLVRESGF